MFLMHLAWQAQWQDYMLELHANLSRPALTVPIFKQQVSDETASEHATTHLHELSNQL